MSTTLFWNCRGARKRCTGNYLRHLVGDNEVHFVGLVETKVETLDRAEVDKMIGTNWDFFHYPAIGKSGGILVLWRKDLIKFELRFADDQVVIGSITPPDGLSWAVAVVYGNKDYLRRRSIWQNIGTFCVAAEPVLVGGDFNCCLAQSKKKGGKRVTPTAGVVEMAEFMNCNDLHDLGFVGPQFTWCNNKDGNSQIWVRLDRILMNSEGLSKAPLAMVRHMGRIASDHAPLLFSLGAKVATAPERWVRFEDVWTTYPASWRIVWLNWRKTDTGSPADILNRKCHRTLRALYHWSRQRALNLNRRKTELERRIIELQNLDCTPGGLGQDLEEELRRCVGDLNDTLARLTIWWRQRAKVRWIEQGDANSHFFHLAASGRRRDNRVVLTLPNCDQPVTDQRTIWTLFRHSFGINGRIDRPASRGGLNSAMRGRSQLT
ncbi:uncharacterized protein LOC114579875 [Dendrobium catenatum]|uniref:uncharacterized protein LOC114579875 n=1 Tax=Dendrobium catenatum TaxID=906689 RepID=UPI00109F6315|nr:uncharacterized protein LOC114579875 [Dendrobium catenatum]